MSVTNGQKANQTTFNTAFVSRTVDSSVIGKIALNNTAPESGAIVTNIQREFNSLCSFLGKTLNSVMDNLPVWVSTNAGDPGDNIFERVEALTELIGRRAAIEDIADATDTVVVAFSSPWPDDLYVIDFCIENSASATPIFLQGVVTDRDANGFTVLLNAPTDSADYKLNYSIKKAV